MVQTQIRRSIEPPGDTLGRRKNKNNVQQANTHTNNRIKKKKDNNENSYSICASTTTSGRTFGEDMEPLDEDMVRIASLNVNNLGVKSYSNVKQEALKQWIFDNEIGVIGIQEVGIAFHRQKKYDSLYERMRDIRWKRIKISQANNIRENIEISQYGGTAILAYDEIASRASLKTGKDNSGLGRWTWMLFEGKHGYRTRIISAYNPCKSKGAETVYMQHCRYFQKQGDSTCPRILFQKQLTAQINKWQKMGENIVLLMDCNENLTRLGPLQKAMLHECNLIDPIRLAYQGTNTKLPPTSLTGSCPIDSIFVSKQLQHINRGGWLKHGETVGDHRALYIDIPILTLLGEPPFKIFRPEARRLTCEQPKIMKKFNTLFKTQMEHEGTEAKFDKLMWKVQNDTINVSQIEIEANRIDNSCTNSILYAEKRCRKLKMGQVQWSPELANAGRMISLWNLVLRKKNGRNISSTFIKRMAKKCKINNPMELDIEDVLIERKNANVRYKQIKKDAASKRKEYLVQLAEDYSSMGHESTGNAVRRLVRLEETRQTFRRIKTATKPFYGATEKVTISDSQDNQIITTDKEEIEEAIRYENLSKFKLAYSSPYLRKPLISKIGQHATSKHAQKILRGSFNQKNISSTTKSFMKYLSAPKSVLKSGPLNSHCSLDQAKRYWLKKKERTSSSLSNRHIGTYKALSKENDLLRVVHGVSTLAYETGFTLQRWTYDLDVSLLKKPGKFRPDELRTIGTLEADFNQGAAYHFSHQMMNNAIKHNAIPPSQYARKGSRSIEAAVVKVLFFDYLRINKTEGSFIANDMMQCFDRMAHPVSSLSSQRLGVHPLVAKTMINTLCYMKHYIRTAYGDSDDFYTGSQDKPLQGGVQGNGAAAPIFIAISCVMLNYFESLMTGFRIQTALSLTILSIAAVMYVDDTDILISANGPNETRASIIQRTQKAADIWNNAITQTGGALRPEKCKWYLITFNWRNGKWKYGNCDEDDAQITQRDTNNKIIPIERLDVNFGHKGLGVHTAPDGSHHQQVEAIIKKITTWNQLIKVGYLTKHDIYTSAHTSIFKSVEYILPATSMSGQECKKIDTAMHKTYLSRMGINKHLPLAYRYASKRYQGLNSLHVESQQLISKLQIFLTHMNQNTQLGLSIQAVMESTQLLTCMDTPFFQLSFSEYGFLIHKEKSWISHLWEMITRYAIKIHCNVKTPHTSRTNDSSLMEMAITSQQFNQSELLSLRRCFHYFQILHMSDITDGTGKKIISSYWTNQKDTTRTSKYKWPHQTKPSSSDFRTWQEFLLQVCPIDAQGYLRRPLGEWINNHHQITKWKYHNPTSTLYQHHPKGIKKYQKTTSYTRNQQRYLLQHNVSSSPLDCVDAIVNDMNTVMPIIESIIPNLTSPIDEFRHEIITFFKYVNIPSDGHEIARSIMNGNAIAVSDSSVCPKSGIGTASWIMVNGDSNYQFCSGDHQVPKGNEKMHSYRGELYGIFSILVVLQKLSMIHNITSGKILIACDNLAGVRNALENTHRAKMNQNCYDILWAIHILKSKLKHIQITPQHVKGHQDGKGRNLTRLESLNVFVDERASSFRKYIETQSNDISSKLHYTYSCYVSVEDNPITSNFSKYLKDHISQKMIQQHLHNTNALDENAFHLVDWDNIEHATKALTNSRRIWLTKFVSGFLPTAKKMKEYKLWNSDICPLCERDIENTTHVIVCTNAEKQEKFCKQVERFQKWMKQNSMDPDMIHIITQTISPQQPTSFASNVPQFLHGSKLHEAALDQDRIGWMNFLRGRITKKWTQAHQYHLNQSNYNISQTWTKRFVLQIYKLSHAVWSGRCKMVHDHDELTIHDNEIHRLNDEIETEYALGTRNIRQKDEYLFDKTLEEILEYSLKEKKLWLLNVEASRQYVETCNKNMYDGMRSIMREWQLPLD